MLLFLFSHTDCLAFELSSPVQIDGRALETCNSGWVYNACCAGGGGCGRVFQNATELRNAVALFQNNTSKAILEHGRINCWDVSKVTDMSNLFKGYTSFDKALTCWNVRQVVNMGSMFEGATSYNQALRTWNPVNVKNMTRMFYGAAKFNQQLCRFHWVIPSTPTSGVTDMFQGSGCFFQSDPTEFHPVGTWANVNIPPFCQDCSIYNGLV